MLMMFVDANDVFCNPIMPIVVVFLAGACLAGLFLTWYVQVMMDDTFCRHTSRFLVWWLLGFPFAAWSSYGWGTPFVPAIVTFLLLGTENIGIQIEQPFEVLPMDTIAEACVRGVREILAQHTGNLLSPWGPAAPVAAYHAWQCHKALASIKANQPTGFE